MTFSNINASQATLTKNRLLRDISPFSGMCVTCIDDCAGTCEIAASAVRGPEFIYPKPFGPMTAASQKDYPIDLSHFNIMGSAVGAQGIEADSDKAIFPNVNIEKSIGHDKNIKLKLPIVIPGLGSTDVAKNNWEGLAIGAALSGIILTVGENVCGMDENSVIKNGEVVKSPDLERRVKLFEDWNEGYGAIVVQSNVEDTRLKVLEYAIRDLGVKIVELKWGQGAKDIGGEVKIRNLEKAKMLKKRGYIVLPDPEDPAVEKSFKHSFDEFERHSRIGMVSEEGFLKRVEELRTAGAKYIFLKTGAYRPADLARAIKFASKAKIDLLTIDGAGGGTGMSPWRMMNEWGIPIINIWALTYQYAKTLAERGEFVPAIALAGGITLEDQIFKVLSLGAPFVKLAGMARAPIAAAMVGKTVGLSIENENLKSLYDKYGNTKEEVFITAPFLKSKFNSRFNDIPTSAIGVYTYLQRIAQGLKQFMCGARKFSLDYITRNDITALTKRAAEVTGITYVMDLDKEEAEKILLSN